jgi:hypothetical protein
MNFSRSFYTTKKLEKIHISWKHESKMGLNKLSFKYHAKNDLVHNFLVPKFWSQNFRNNKNAKVSSILTVQLELAIHNQGCTDKAISTLSDL